jgi:hypothetical protein
VFRRKERLPGTLRVEVTVDDWTEVTSVEELDRHLDAIDSKARAKGWPMAGRLVSLKGHGSLDVVVGADRSWLHHTPENGMPPYRVSHGDFEADGFFVFLHEGDHPMEGEWSETVPSDAARGAARYFLRTGNLDERIQWAEV